MITQVSDIDSSVVFRGKLRLSAFVILWGQFTSGYDGLQLLSAAVNEVSEPSFRASS